MTSLICVPGQIQKITFQQANPQVKKINVNVVILAPIFITNLPTTNFDLITVFVRVALQIAKKAQHFVLP